MLIKSYGHEIDSFEAVMFLPDVICNPGYVVNTFLSWEKIAYRFKQQ